MSRLGADLPGLRPVTVYLLGPRSVSRKARARTGVENSNPVQSILGPGSHNGLCGNTVTSIIEDFIAAGRLFARDPKQLVALDLMPKP